MCIKGPVIGKPSDIDNMVSVKFKVIDNLINSFDGSSISTITYRSLSAMLMTRRVAHDMMYLTMSL